MFQRWSLNRLGGKKQENVSEIAENVLVRDAEDMEDQGVKYNPLFQDSDHDSQYSVCNQTTTTVINEVKLKSKPGGFVHPLFSNNVLRGESRHAAANGCLTKMTDANKTDNSGCAEASTSVIKNKVNSTAGNENGEVNSNSWLHKGTYMFASPASPCASERNACGDARNVDLNSNKILEVNSWDGDKSSQIREGQRSQQSPKLSRPQTESNEIRTVRSHQVRSFNKRHEKPRHAAVNSSVYHGDKVVKSFLFGEFRKSLPAYTTKRQPSNYFFNKRYSVRTLKELQQTLSPTRKANQNTNEDKTTSAANRSSSAFGYLTRKNSPDSKASSPSVSESSTETTTTTDVSSSSQSQSTTALENVRAPMATPQYDTHVHGSAANNMTEQLSSAASGEQLIYAEPYEALEGRYIN